MATNTSKKRRQQQRQATIRIVILAVILVLINMLAVYFHYGLDLTKEKRFTLSPSTVNLLKNMKEVAVIDVYLKGKYPAGFQRLEQSTRERLQSFKDIAGAKVVFRFIDPLEGKNEKEQGEIFQQLGQKGITGVNLQVKGDEEGYSVKPIFPWALVHYNGKEKAVQLLENHSGMQPLETLNYSEILLEYKFASAIHSLTLPDKPQIAYMVGNGEPSSSSVIVSDALNTMAANYLLDTFDLTRGVKIPLVYDAIVITKPTLPFTDTEKFKIDQYVMRGGHVLWALDMLNTPMDSLRLSPQFIALEYGLNLDDILFKYGVRINPDLIEDINCAPLGFVAGQNGDRPQIELKPWVYFPVFNPISSHPIVRNMDVVLGKFANSIDTIANPEIKKTILLQSSKYSRVAAAPVRVSLSMMNYPQRPELFNKPNKPVAVLLEGRFKSVFEHRLAPSFLQQLQNVEHQPFKPECDTPNSMIVLSDGDLMTNDYSAKRGPMELGEYTYVQQRFSNKNFLLNCLEYLTDHSGLLEARSKDVKVRLLDVARIKKERLQWQVINVTIPIAAILIFASCYIFFRKRKYEVKVVK